MKRHHKAIAVILISAMITGTIYTSAFAWDNWKKDDPITDEWNAMDLIFARPLGVAAAILGLGIFSVSLPFTIAVDAFSKTSDAPTSAVKDAAKTLMLNPLKFSFAREFPDENM
jgi:hypothetical protein